MQEGLIHPRFKFKCKFFISFKEAVTGDLGTKQKLHSQLYWSLQALAYTKNSAHLGY